MAAIYLAENNFPITFNNIIRGISNIKINTDFGFRIEKINEDPLIIIDVSHNQDSITKLVETVKMIGKDTK
jgi:folylpolyglutamate synthase/dihydropteroate synthase